MKQFKRWLIDVEKERAKQPFLHETVNLEAEDRIFISKNGSCYTISIGTSQDISDLLRVQKESYGNIQWQRNSLNHDFLFNQRSLYLVVRDESQKVMAFIGVWMKNKEVHITNLCVSSDYQRKGLATFLIELIAKIAKEKGLEIYTLEVRVSNQNAITLYKRREFAVVGERTGYYKDNGEDALLMERQLFPRKEENYA